VLQRGDEELVVPADVVGEDGVLLGHAEEELLIVAQRLLLHNLRHVGDELADGPLGAERRCDEVQAVHGTDLDRRVLVSDLLLEELEVVEVSARHRVKCRRAR